MKAESRESNSSWIEDAETDVAKKRTKKKKISPFQIEHQQIVGEVQVTSVDRMRLSRVKYEGNEYTFIDIRLFRRGWGGVDGDEEIYYPSTKGVQMKETDFWKLIEHIDVAKPAPTRQIH